MTIYFRVNTGNPLLIRIMGKRKRYTNEEKLTIVRLVSQAGNNISSVARGQNLPPSTVQGWCKQKEELEKFSTEHHNNAGKNSKAIHTDKTPQLTIGLKAFCEQARSLNATVTNDALSIQAKQLSSFLLKAYETQQTRIQPTEANALKKLEFSQKWAFNWLRKNNFTSKVEVLHGDETTGDADRSSSRIANDNTSISHMAAISEIH